MIAVAAALVSLTFAQVGTPDLYASPNWALSKLPVASCSDSGQACQKDADCPGFTPPILIGFDMIPTGETCTGPVKSGGIQKFVNTLPGLCAFGKTELGQCLPVAVPDRTRFPGADYYELGLTQYQMQFHRDLPGTTQIRGYYQKNAPQGDEAGTPHYLGPIIVAQTNRPVRVTFTNELGTGAAGHSFIPVDPTLPGAGFGPDGVHEYTENRATVHLHGGNTPWISDGTQHQWTAPAGENTPYKKGWTVGYVPDMWFDASGNPITTCDGQTTCNQPGATNDPGEGKLTFYWTNQQSGRMMFFHDHAYAITRLNVYAGEAAGYLLANPPDEDALAHATVPGTLGTRFFDPSSQDPNATDADLAHVVPLVIQDKTFVPPPAQLAEQDPTWDPAKWGPEGNLWFPHVYIPNQWPGNPDDSNTNPYGRWDYGPWFWPPQSSLVEVTSSGQVVNRPLTQPCTTAALADPVTGAPGPTECPTIPNPSAVPESFLDTMVVNGTAYPTLTVDPVAYRFQILNAAQERNVNLSFFVADASGTEVPMVPAVAHGKTSSLPLCSTTAPVSPVTGLPVGCWPIKWPIDGRYGGVPDPLAAGPAIVQIGSESGILPAPAVIPAQPVNYEYNRRNVVVLNVSDKGLFMGPAERADVVVDFSAYAGKTLILYNDSPAPVPGLDVRLDYFTGDYDQTAGGGAPSTLPGYGPNTRTIMQLVVRGTAPANPPPAFDPGAVATALASRFAVSQPPPIVPEAVLSPVYGKTFANTYATLQANELTYTPVCASTTPASCPPGAVTLTMGQKAIQELFDTDYGRMDATLGVEMAMTNFLQQTTIPYSNFDPATEFLTDTKPQIWKITHNGVDTHTIHFHLLSVQIINRVGWDGQIRPPDANEFGWKESVRMHPLEIIFVALQPVRQTLPWPIPDLIRPLDVTRALHTTTQFTSVDLQNRPITVSNEMTNFGWEYVWHCHLLGHEEADMLRGEIFVTAPEDPSDLNAVSSATPGQVILTWRDNSRSAQSFTIERDASPYFTTTPATTFTVSSPAAQPGPVNFTDTTVADGTAYWYRVQGTKSFASQADPLTTYRSSSGWSNVAEVGTYAKAVVAPASLAFGDQLVSVTSAVRTVTLTNVGSGVLAIGGFAVTGASAAQFATPATTCGASLAIGASCVVDVTFTPASTGLKGASLAFSTSDPYAPVVSATLGGTGVTPIAGASATSLAFGNQMVTTTSAAQTVTLSNTGTGPLAIASIGLTGADAGDFGQTTDCGATLAAGAGCTINVTFAPTSVGAKSASVRISSSDLANPTIDVGVTGTGIVATANVSPAALAFGNRQVGTTSAAQQLTVSNSGTASLAISTVSVAGANPGDFAATSACGTSLAPGASCTIGVSFTPAAPGPRTASVSVTSNDPVQPVVSVPLTGTGISVTLTSSKASPQQAGTAVTFAATAQGGSNYEYQFWLSSNGGAWVTVQNWGASGSWTMPSSTASGSYKVSAYVRLGSAGGAVAFTVVSYQIATTIPPATGVNLSADKASPQVVGTPVTFTAVGQGPAGSSFQYQFWLSNGSGWTMVQDYGIGTTWTMLGTTPAGAYTVSVYVRTSATVKLDAMAMMSFSIRPSPATGVTLTTSAPSPHPAGTPVTFSAAGQGPAGSVYQYQFWLNDGSGWTMVQDYGIGSTWTMLGTTPPATYQVSVYVRTSTLVRLDAYTTIQYRVQ